MGTRRDRVCLRMGTRMPQKAIPPPRPLSLAHLLLSRAHLESGERERKGARKLRGSDQRLGTRGGGEKIERDFEPNGQMDR